MQKSWRTSKYTKKINIATKTGTRSKKCLDTTVKRVQENTFLMPQKCEGERKGHPSYGETVATQWKWKIQ